MDVGWKVGPGSHQGSNEPTRKENPEGPQGAWSAEEGREWGRAEEGQGSSPAQEGMPRRSGRQAPKDQSRGLEATANPGQYDYLRKKKDRAQEEGSGQKQEEQGNRRRGQQGSEGQGRRVPHDEHSPAPTCAMDAPGEEGTGSLDPDDTYQVAWVATSEGIPEDDRAYLTSTSSHSREVRDTQLPARREFLEARRYPDGHDGLTLRQVVTSLANAQGGLSRGQVEALEVALGRRHASNNSTAPLELDDTWCYCGRFVQAAATMCPCGFPTAGYRKGDWKCGVCGFASEAGLEEQAKRKCQCCWADIGAGYHAYGDDTTDSAHKMEFLEPGPPREEGLQGEAREGPRESPPGYASRKPSRKGWEAAAIPDRNYHTEYQRYKEDQEEQRQRFGGPAWDGRWQPCICLVYDFAHFHKGYGFKEGQRLEAGRAKELWGDIILKLNRNEKEQRRALDEQLQEAQEEMLQAAEAKHQSAARCSELQSIVGEAHRALQERKTEGRQKEAKDTARQVARRVRAEEDARDVHEAALARFQKATADEDVVEQEEAKARQDLDRAHENLDKWEEELEAAKARATRQLELLGGSSAADGGEEAKGPAGHKARPADPGSSSCRREEGQSEKGQGLQHQAKRGTEAPTHKATRTALKELEEAIRDEAKAAELREACHERCEAAGWPRLDTRDAEGKATNLAFSRANDSFYEASEARLAKEEEVSKLQGTEARSSGAREPDKSQASNHAENGAQGRQESPGEAKKRRSEKKLADEHKTKHPQGGMDGGCQEELHAAWAKSFKKSMWAQHPIEACACAEREEEFRQLSDSIEKAKALKQEVCAAEEQYVLQEETDKAADAESHGSYSSGELVIPGSREEAEREALEGYVPDDSPGRPQDLRDQ
jgi:hypothetical protein